ncbi:hypothetical protein [Enterobacter ludwigii]|uniref:hypothetical protein n=1 Tax=Enterobacter ludwigii TaxID=299767 RepID=UPI0040677838
MAENASLDPTTMPNCTGEAGEPATKCNQEFSHRIKLVPVDEALMSLRDIPWSAHFEEDKYNGQGVTDAEGKTERIKTPQPKKFFALIGKLAEGYRKRGGNFGSLKEVEERKISLVTAPKYPEKEVPYCSGYDYITVVGARTAPRDWRWQGGFGLTEESKGNQYRFINCGLRQLRDFPQSSKGSYSVQRIMVVFKQGYSEYDISKINEYAEKQSSRIIYVRNKDEFVSFLRRRKAKKRLIKKMVFFCHGIINIASFHYSGDNENAGEFFIGDINDVYESVFDYDAEIITYACRAGISVDGNDLTGKDAGQKQSPAQKMADTWDVKVNAFEMRSSYVGVYGTGKEIKEVSDYEKKIEKYKREMSEYKNKKANGEKNLKIPVKPEYYDEMLRRRKDIDERDANQSKSGGPIAPNGSWRYPTSGDTPVGLKKGLLLYRPKEWEK